jgi:hypothetical protein
MSSTKNINNRAKVYILRKHSWGIFEKTALCGISENLAGKQQQGQ